MSFVDAFCSIYLLLRKRLLLRNDKAVVKVNASSGKGWVKCYVYVDRFAFGDIREEEKFDFVRLGQSELSYPK